MMEASIVKIQVETEECRFGEVLDDSSRRSVANNFNTSTDSSSQCSNSSEPDPLASNSPEIRVRELCYSVNGRGSGILCGKNRGPRKKILENVSFNAKPGEILAIVGPSGAGKSSLLEILAGRIKVAKKDAVSVNGRPVGAAALRWISGYVTQEDALLPLLTVKETLMFSAEFRLPSKITKKEKEEKVDKLMGELGLSHVADSRIGDDNVRGVSGGERRRVSIGVDLIHDPSVLLLDEPTSGLDSAAALNVVEILHCMAAGVGCRRTIVLTIHQPSYRILGLISSLLLISHGKVVRHGSMKCLQDWLESSGRKVPAQLNALEYALEVISELEEDAQSESTELVRVSGFSDDKEDTFRSFSEDQTVNSNNNNEGEAGVVAVESTNPVTSPAFTNSRCSEIWTLSRRFCKIIYRTQQLFLARTLQAVVAGLGLGSVYFNVGFNQRGLDERLGFFAFTLTFLLSSTTEALPIFLQERQILMRETSRGAYRVSSYVISNALVFVPFLLIVAVLFAVPVYFLVGLSPTLPAFMFFLFTVWLIVLMANSLVVFLSALAPDFISGNSLIFTVLGAFFLFSGYFISEQNIPKYWLFMHYISLYKYPLDNMMINEYSSLSSKCFAWIPGFNICAATGHDILEKRGLHERSRWTNVQIMLAFTVFYRVLCYFVLKRRSSKSKGG